MSDTPRREPSISDEQLANLAIVLPKSWLEHNLTHWEKERLLWLVQAEQQRRSQERATTPRLDVIAEDGDIVVSLRSIPNWHLSAHGVDAKTALVALASAIVAADKLEQERATTPEAQERAGTAAETTAGYECAGFADSRLPGCGWRGAEPRRDGLVPACPRCHGIACRAQPPSPEPPAPQAEPTLQQVVASEPDHPLITAMRPEAALIERLRERQASLESCARQGICVQADASWLAEEYQEAADTLERLRAELALAEMTMQIQREERVEAQRVIAARDIEIVQLRQREHEAITHAFEAGWDMGKTAILDGLSGVALIERAKADRDAYLSSLDAPVTETEQQR